VAEGVVVKVLLSCFPEGSLSHYYMYLQYVTLDSPLWVWVVSLQPRYVCSTCSIVGPGTVRNATVNYCTRRKVVVLIDIEIHWHLCIKLKTRQRQEFASQAEG